MTNFTTLRYGDIVDIDGMKVIAHDAGHVLGSTQYEIRDAESSIVYTGDINCRKTLTTNAADIVPCDTLILETTYGRPTYVFPSLTEIYSNIVNWAIGEIKKKRKPVFIGYAIGKSQEIIKIFNEFTNIPVVVSKSITKVNEVALFVILKSLRKFVLFQNTIVKQLFL